ncbi:Ubiquitin carboxyl-terminal hydrolase 42 [Coemansia sp. IMI 209127]|nr:Ubiquitin carboxyl-terminal hydrolase 42 [Coemansia sp. IMI 209127]
MPTDAAKAVFSKALGVAGPMDGRKLSIGRVSRQPSPSRSLPLDSGIFYRGELRCSKGNGTGDSESKSTRTSEIRVGDDVGGVAAEIISKSNAVNGAGSYELSGSRSIIGDASDGDNATVVSGFYGGTHDYSDSFSTFELDFSPASDALSLSDSFDELDFVLVGDVDVLPALSRVDSHLVKHPKAFIRMLIPVLQGCQEWRARSICSKSFEMELWTLEYCCKPTRGSEQIEKRSWLSFKSGEFTSLGDALNRFIAPKVLGKLNLSTCGECGKVNLGGQTRVSALSALPPILTIQLVGSGGIFGTEKGTRRMRFAAELDMRPYVRHSHDRTQKTIYSLFLVVAHDGGSSRKGNYTSFARSSNNDWYRCRAGHHPEVVCKDIVLAANARMLVYTLV